MFYWKSTCSTCRDARAWVLELQPTLPQRNYAKEPMTAEEARQLVDAAGSVLAVLNTRHAIVKERGWKEHPPSKEEFSQAVALENNLIRRPITVRNGTAVVGFDREALSRLLK